MISQSPPSDAARRLSDLRRSQPTDQTLRNLLGVLNAKMELCARLPVYEYEASAEGHEESAIAFRRLAEAERGICNDVLEQLKAHLDSRSAVL